MMEVLRADSVFGIARTGYYLQETQGRLLRREPHSHDFYEFICLVSGKCVHRKNDEETSLLPGDTVSGRPGEAHCFVSQSADANIAAVSVTVQKVRDLLMQFEMTGGELPSFFRLPEDTVFSLRRAVRATAVNDPSARRQSLCAIGMLLASAASKTDAPDMPESFSRALAAFDSEEGVRGGVPYIALVSGYAHSQLNRLFRKYCGTTPGAYAASARMRYAVRLLAADVPVSQAAERVGFQSAAHFSQFIRRMSGMTPSALKKSLLNSSGTV